MFCVGWNAPKDDEHSVNQCIVWAMGFQQQAHWLFSLCFLCTHCKVLIGWKSWDASNTNAHPTNHSVYLWSPTEPGNLVLKINLLKHPVFTRHHNDLYCNASISLRDALLGFEFDIEHLDGHKVCSLPHGSRMPSRLNTSTTALSRLTAHMSAFCRFYLFFNGHSIVSIL